MNTVIIDQQPQVCFLPSEKLCALTNCKKKFTFGVLFSRKFVFGSFQVDFSASGRGGGGARSHPHRTPLPTHLSV